MRASESATSILPAESKDTLVGFLKPDSEVCEVAATLETKFACPMTVSAEGAFWLATSTETGKRRTRLLPVSVTHRLPPESNVSPVCGKNAPLVRNSVLAVTPPTFG